MVWQKKKKEEATKRLTLCHAQGRDKSKMRGIMHGCNTLYELRKEVKFENKFENN